METATFYLELGAIIVWLIRGKVEHTQSRALFYSTNVLRLICSNNLIEIDTWGSMGLLSTNLLLRIESHRDNIVIFVHKEGGLRSL